MFLMKLFWGDFNACRWRAIHAIREGGHLSGRHCMVSFIRKVNMYICKPVVIVSEEALWVKAEKILPAHDSNE